MCSRRLGVPAALKVLSVTLVISICLSLPIQSLDLSPTEAMFPPGFVHQACRNAIYQGSNVKRFSVPDNLVSWLTLYPDYSPVFYESKNLIGKPWADPAIDDESFQPKWHSLDGPCSRISYHGTYEIRDKYPLNPAGRTGIIGRGLLGRWGVNHAADPVVTKWKRNADGTTAINSSTGKNILQVIAIQRKDNLLWAFPGGMVDPGEKATTTSKREFIEEALNSNKVQKIEKFFEQDGIEVYRGYVDDPRNTDNAWMETSAYNFHDDTGEALEDIKFEAGDDARNATWLDIDHGLELHASHIQIAEKIVKRLNAHW